MNRFRKKMQEQLEEEERIKWQDAIDGDLNTSFLHNFLAVVKVYTSKPKTESSCNGGVANHHRLLSHSLLCMERSAD